MSSQIEDSGETSHSKESQDTELIDESNMSLVFPSNMSSTGSSYNSPHVDKLLVSRQMETSSNDTSLLDFSSPNVTTTTACSTPHERKFQDKILRKRFTASSDEYLDIKKPKLFDDELLDNSYNKTDDASQNKVKLNAEFTEVSSSSSEAKFLEKGLTVEQVGSKSYSSTQKVSSNSSCNSVDGIMVRKARSPANYYAQNPLKKAFSDDYHETDNLAALKARIIDLESQVQLLQSKRRKDDKKEQHGKHMSTEKFLCSFSYVFDDSEGEISSIALKQVSKGDFFDSKHTRLSISSGSLADSSGSEMVHHWVQRGPSLASTYSSSSVTSSTSSIPSQSGRPTFTKFLVPQIPESKKYLSFKYPKNCVCQCYCTTFIDCLAKQAVRCITPETLSSSSENIKSDTQDLASLNFQTTYPRQDHPRDSSLGSEKADLPPTDISDNTISVFRSRSSIYNPISINLPVFAKWPSNSFCYPGIIENATEEMWHTSSHLDVMFCDGTRKKILSENLFPAYLLPSGTEISFEKDDICETANLVSIQRLENNELVCLGEIRKEVPEIIEIPFEKIFISDSCYKCLKKTRDSVLTPKKTPRFSVSEVNVTEGKRTRKLVKFESSIPKLSSGSSGRRIRSKGKRTRSTTDTSGSDNPKSDKKKPRSLSQKKSQLKKTTTDHAAITPQVNAKVKRNVYRKLYVETPGCSKPGAITVIDEHELPANSSTDTDSSLPPEVKLEDVCESILDVDKLFDVSQGRQLIKSKQNIIGLKDDKIKGPIPEMPIFSGFNFVLTHSEPKVYSIEKQDSQDSYSEGSGTDFEDYYRLPEIPFDSIHLKKQIWAGKGIVYRSILDVPSKEHSRTILITDNIVETPNYLLAISLRIQIFRHDLIINSCIQNKTVSQMLGNSMTLPLGRSLKTGRWVEKHNSSQPFFGSICAFSLSSNLSTINFWWHILTNTGAKVFSDSDTLKIISGFQSTLTFIVGDESTPKEVIQAAEKHGIPVVSTLWVLQSIIHGFRLSPVSNGAFIISSTSLPCS